MGEAAVHALCAGLMATHPDLGRGLEGGLLAILEFLPDLFLGALLPSLMIAGGIRVFVPRSALIGSIGHENRWISYSIAVTAGVLFTGCSCGVIPLFLGVYNAGVGVGPACAFLFAGPAVSILAVVLTWQLFGASMALGRLALAIVVAVVIGLLMDAAFKGAGRFAVDKAKLKKDKVKELKPPAALIPFFVLLFVIMTLAVLNFDLRWKVGLQALWLVVFSYWLATRFTRAEVGEWIHYTGHFLRKIAVPMFLGIFAVGVIRVFFSPVMVQAWVGNNSVSANVVASSLGAAMYFGTCTGVLVVKALQVLGMAPGPAMALFLSGHSVSLPSIVTLWGIMGWRRTTTYVLLVVGCCTVAGLLFGGLAP